LHILVLGADHRGAAEVEDLLDGRATSDHVDRPEAEVAAELEHQLADR
jgi:hypothetical protein